MEEVWKDVKGSDTVKVSKDGKLLDTSTNELLPIWLDSKGYPIAAIEINGKPTLRRVHTLVAEAFVGERPPGYDVNHKVGVKSNVSADNLEYTTRSENVLHAYRTGLNPHTHTIRIVETGETFKGISECARAIGGDPENIRQCLYDKYDRQSCRGYHFEFVDKCEPVRSPKKIRIKETGEIFNSARECERVIGGAHRNIVMAATNGNQYNGLHFEVVDESKPIVEKPPFLYPHQEEAVGRMFDGCILKGGVGSGKSRTGLYYYFKEFGGQMEPEYVYMKDPCDLIIITTAKKRNDKEWEGELAPYLLSTNPEVSAYKNEVIVDSWQNIQKYADRQGSFFIFDEDHVTGEGAWVKAFLKIVKKNRWIILSASPGDTWQDYTAVFIANGFYKNKTEFKRAHLRYDPYCKNYPRVIGYMNETRLIRLRNKILIDMDFKRHTIPHHEDIYVRYDIPMYKEAMKTRWDPYKNEPMKQASELCYVLRRIVNSDESRQIALLELYEKHPRMIVFYSFDYERDILLNLYYGEDVEIAEYSGHAHQPIPTSDKWVYIVNYTAGCEGFNCIKTDTIVFYSQSYSYKTMLQAAGRIDRLNTPYTDLYYYHIKSRSGIDLAISKALTQKKNFNEGKWIGKW